ncbi:alpha/beta fold hydrolase [Streptomonospora sediminis]
MTTPVDQSDVWFRRFQPAPQSAVRLVCLPHAGGSASFYLPMARALSPEIDVVCAQYPGRQDRLREQCIDTIDGLADELFAAVQPWCDRPIAIFGHSMGATLGFELTRRIEAESSATVTRFFASGRRAPSAFRDETVHQRDDDGIIAELQRLSGTDTRILGDEEILRMALPAIRADYRAAETYRYQGGPALRCPVTVLAGDADPKTTADEARQWKEHTEAECDVHLFSGGHFFLADHQAEILDLITDRLG